MTITFSVPLPPAGLRKNRLTLHHGYRASLVREYAEQVWCAGREGIREEVTVRLERDRGAALTVDGPWKRARVHYEWRSIHQVDEDNIIASMKAALDVIKSTGPRPLGVIEDDAGAVVTATWVKAKTRAEECVEIRIERLEDPMNAQRDAR